MPKPKDLTVGSNVFILKNDKIYNNKKTSAILIKSNPILFFLFFFLFNSNDFMTMPKIFNFNNI